ncbi:MAG: hypothetical protein IKE65_06265 [Clostridia bacterium]|nr:hypothetical protein [Clostridia bacterium]
MSKSVEQDALKSQKKKKIAKIIAIVAAVLLVGWTVYSIAMNPNQKERYVLNSYIKHYTEADKPAAYQLKDCSALYESATAEGKAFDYAIIEVESEGESEKLLLIVNGAGEGKAFAKEELDSLDCSDKQSIDFEITQRDEDIHLSKVQKQLKRYWQFHDRV